MRILKLFLIVCLLLAPGALTARECYVPEEYEAEQGLRLHTDLEVISLTCKYDGYRRPLRQSYGVFVKKYSKWISGWENTIARLYAYMGNSKNEVIDNFRTSLANAKGREAGTLTPRQFCLKYANWVPAVASWTPDQVKEYIRRPDPDRKTRKPLCD